LTLDKDVANILAETNVKVNASIIPFIIIIYLYYQQQLESELQECHERPATTTKIRRTNSTDTTQFQSQFKEMELMKKNKTYKDTSKI
jgi:hypothetical protein